MVGYHDRGILQHVIAAGCDLCDGKIDTAAVDDFTVQLQPPRCTCYAPFPPEQPQFHQCSHRPRRSVGPVRLRGNCRLAVRTLPYPAPLAPQPLPAATLRHHQHHQLQQHLQPDGLCRCRVSAVTAGHHQQLLSHEQMLFVPFSMPANYGSHVTCPATQSGGASATAAAAAAAAVATLANGGNPNMVVPSSAAIVNGNAAAGLKVRVLVHYHQDGL